MPISDVVSDIEGADGPTSDGDAPEEMNAPTGNEPTTLDTPDGLAPYLHNQQLDDYSALALGGSALTLGHLLQRWM